MRDQPLQKYIKYDLYPFFMLLIYPAPTSWIVTEGILKDVKIQEMSIPEIIVDCAYLGQCHNCRETVKKLYKYFKHLEQKAGHQDILFPPSHVK